jgi:heavy metal efflux system protein
MIGWLLDFSLRQRLLVASGAALIAAWGFYAAQRIAIDAFPDVTTVQVMVATQMPGQPPADVERFVTVPVEIHLMGLPGLAEIRSLSKFGLSQITVVFDDDVDVYFARQLVLERLIEVKRRLPPTVEPLMMPVSTGLGEVYQYYLVADQDLPDGPGTGA